MMLDTFNAFAGRQRLKPVTLRIARWSGWFISAGWSLYDVAELFDVSPEALEKVLA